MGYAVRFLFGNVPRLLSGAMLLVAAPVARSCDQNHAILVRLRFDFDRSSIQDFSSEGLLKPASSLEREVKAR